MDTKSKRYLNRSQNTARVPRHYSHLIEDDIFTKAGLWIVGGIIVFLVLVVIGALVS